MEEYTRQLPTLDAYVRGAKLREGTAIQYRGIPYASIKQRFDLPRPIHSFNGQTLDGTQHGPICPQQDFDSERLWFNIPDDQEIYPKSRCVQDELACLNLIVTTPPPTASANTELLPVLLYIHGGSFAYGSAVRKVEDLSGIVAESWRIGKPIVAVAVNYRVNLPGFALGNHGLHDQRCAMAWVREHICDFAGNPGRVTLAGDSSGGACVQAHLQTAPAGLFQRAMMFSGTLGTTPPRTPAQQREGMRRVCRQLHIAWQDGWEEVLKQVPIERLKDVFQRAMYPTKDGFFRRPGDALASAWTQPGVSPTIPPWCDAVLLGDNSDESLIWGIDVFPQDPENLKECIRQSLPDDDRGRQVMSAYFGDNDEEDVHEAALRILNDVLFAQPVASLAETWAAAGKKVFRYTFDQPNPFLPDVGPTHDINLLFTWNAYEISMDEEATAVRRELQSRLLGFVYGEDPWTAGVTFGFGPEGFAGECDESEYASRRRIRKMEVFRRIPQETLQELAKAIITGRTPLHKARL